MNAEQLLKKLPLTANDIVQIKTYSKWNKWGETFTISWKDPHLTRLSVSDMYGPHVRLVKEIKNIQMNVVFACGYKNNFYLQYFGCYRGFPIGKHVYFNRFGSISYSVNHSLMRNSLVL